MKMEHVPKKPWFSKEALKGNALNNVLNKFKIPQKENFTLQIYLFIYFPNCISIQFFSIN